MFTLIDLRTLYDSDLMRMQAMIRLLYDKTKSDCFNDN